MSQIKEYSIDTITKKLNYFFSIPLLLTIIVTILHCCNIENIFNDYNSYCDFLTTFCPLTINIFWAYILREDIKFKNWQSQTESSNNLKAWQSYTIAHIMLCVAMIIICEIFRWVIFLPFINISISISYKVNILFISCISFIWFVNIKMFIGQERFYSHMKMFFIKVQIFLIKKILSLSESKLKNILINLLEPISK